MVEDLPPTVELLAFINWFLIIAEMVSLYAGVVRFRQIVLVGSWFRWKAFGYTILVLGANVLGLYFLWRGDPLFVMIQLTFSRISRLWETLYCFYYKFDKLSVRLQYALCHPEAVDPTFKLYVPVCMKVWKWLKAVKENLQNKI